jgi:putative ABC transport system substrate-binding protein
VKRREFITLLGGAVIAWPLAARGQRARRCTSVSWPSLHGQPRTGSASKHGCRSSGLSTDEIKFINPRGPEGINAAMRELVANMVDIIVATGNELSPKAALAATNMLPTVMIAIDYDPLALGYVGTLARPGGNLTGLFYQQIDLTLHSPDDAPISATAAAIQI